MNITMYAGSSNNILFSVSDSIDLSQYSVKITFKKDGNNAWSKSYDTSDVLTKNGQTILLHILKNDFTSSGNYLWQIMFVNGNIAYKSTIGTMKVLEAIVN